MAAAAIATAAALFFRIPNSVRPANKLLHQNSSFIIPSTMMPPPPIHLHKKQQGATTVFKPTRSATGSPPSPGLYSASQFELTTQNVDMVLEDVRPYLIADGGNVDVVSTENGVVSLKLQEDSLVPWTLGACGSCPSSTTTMKMGIERVLKEKFGDALKEIRQVVDDEQINDITPEVVNSHLDLLRPAIKNYGGSVQVLSVDGGDCVVKYEGPESIGSGIKAAIKEKFPDIVNVVFTD